MKWDPFSIRAWADAFGNARAPWFGGTRTDTPEGEHEVLLDGHASSFALSKGTDPGQLVYSPDPLGWAWSSYLRHLIVLIDKPDHSRVFLRRWDEPDGVRQLRIPRSPQEAEALLSDVISGYRPRSAEVVPQMLSAFKSLRAVLSVYGATDVEIVRAYNLVVAVMELPESREEMYRVERFSDVLKIASDHGADELPDFGEASISDTVGMILRASPRGVPLLDAHMLIRHASGYLWQEAHFHLERQAVAQQSLFGGLMPNPTTKGQQQRDARFTPTELARSLVEQALREIGGDRESLSVLDPACGSGVFLQATLRELESRRFPGRVQLVGFDTSPVSREMTTFCLRRSVEDARRAGVDASLQVEPRNAVKEEWGIHDVILMNPPFAAYRDMSREERDDVRQALGNDLAVGHFDKSMAFIRKAASALAPGGAFASVMPSMMLDSSHGEKWRRWLLDNAEMASIGRFRGYGYFPGAMVEPAFIVMRNRERYRQATEPLTLLVSEERAADRSLRSLRKREPSTETRERPFYLSFSHDRNAISSASWMPQYRYESLLKAIDPTTPRVEDLFEVNQGALTGMNDAFVLSHREYSLLPKPEREYFRPAAGTNTIRNGKLIRKEFVFFPYDENGPLFHTEEDVAAKVNEYFTTRLKPHQSRLGMRPDTQGQWWDLAKWRKWQLGRKPKIVSAYFGASGHFAFDSTGEFVCLHGYAWNKRDEPTSVRVEGESVECDEVSLSFYDTEQPWAYVAILNSRPFSVLLSCFCQRVQGGQYNLSKRFVRAIPIPDLGGGPVPGDLLELLATIGRRFADAEPVDHEHLSSLVSRVYGVPLELWKLGDKT